MLFNSINFAIFLPIVFILYWFFTKRNLKIQNKLLLISSYFFYACWDWRFLFLLLFSTLLDYLTGLKMQTSENQKQKKRWFWLSVIINLGFLGIFKYYNFFAESFADIMSNLGWTVSPLMINIILPVGISFYTFHGLSYIIDIYKNRIKAEKSFINYAVFVSFFPLLVAGPIERATHLLPQIKKQRSFDYFQAIDGLRQILWGLFKKIVIADNCAIYANEIFNNYADMNGSSLILGAIFFTFQIYGDFSGYSDIALGTARLFGIELLQNFAFPYFSRDIAEFWRRWHISLSSWFKDYIYIPLGGSKGGDWMRIRNTLIIFIISGFWHGANWTFIVWGFLNALFIMPSIIMKTNRNNIKTVAEGRLLPTIKEFIQMILTFGLTVFAWIFFRSENLGQAVNYILGIFSLSVFDIPKFDGIENSKTIIVLLIIFIITEWRGRENKYALERLKIIKSKTLRWIIYILVLLSIYFYGNFGETVEFIYFQF
ncbi:MBOAT family O-acyltransferase [Epilithonimonas zeae]|uniref:D-alanyl-lipoteichoic acid acyltransferase DltB, MBOAT superfamily n=1 Tax=Epilithonimonas zeae TaxID=1416779 RepID=A0A1N6FGW5_9FLAO|nr:MBOAT family O-acyltransferase [Epilithonimonas zeae]SIN94487.1 D-alanyl-lipoteichoic acid acyltransferase DltB, MBOAT superfamily [Epilithonimonas zeae]